MEYTRLPVELIAFLNLYVHSVRQLEALLLLQENPAAKWTVRGAAQALSANESALSVWLKEFVSAGLVTEIKEGPQFQFLPMDKRNSELVALLAKEYRLRPLKVIDAIVNQPTQKMMSFLEAFKIKKGDSDGC